MDSVNIDDLSALCRIAVADSEKEGLKKDLEHILGYVSELGDIPVGSEASAVPAALMNVMRDDVEPYPPGAFTKEILDNAPRTEDGFLVVKKILEK